MAYFDDLAAAIAVVNASYSAIEEAIKDEPGAGDIQRLLAARILLDMVPILERLQLRSSFSSKFGGAAGSVTEFQAEYTCLEDL